MESDSSEKKEIGQRESPKRASKSEVQQTKVNSLLMKHGRDEARNLLRLPVLHTAITSKHVARSVLLERELLSLHTELVCVALANCLDRSTTLLDDVSTHEKLCKHQQFILKFLKHHLIVRAGREIRLVHGEKKRTGMSHEGRAHEEIVEVSICQERNRKGLCDGTHIVLRSINQIDDSSSLGNVLHNLSTRCTCLSRKPIESRMTGHVNDFSVNRLGLFSLVRRSLRKSRDVLLDGCHCIREHVLGHLKMKSFRRFIRCRTEKFFRYRKVPVTEWSCHELFYSSGPRDGLSCTLTHEPVSKKEYQRQFQQGEDTAL